MLKSAKAARRACAGPLTLILVAATLAGCGGSSTGGSSTGGSSGGGSRGGGSRAGSSAESAAHRPAVSRTATRQQTTSAQEAYAVPVVSHAQRRQLAAFALLRARPTGLPAAVRRFLRKPVFGVNWSLARRIPAKSSGRYWLLPGNKHLCVVSEGVMGSSAVGTSCATTAEAIAHGVAEVSMGFPGTPHRYRLIVGVAPSGIGEVIVHTRGSISRARVHHEVFVLRDTTFAAPDVISLRSRHSGR